MNVSAVDIANLALDKLGARAIMTFDDGTPQASLAKRTWSLVRPAVLAEHPWSSVIERATLAASAANPIYGFSYQYPLPANTLKVVEVYTNYDYQVEASSILTNQANSVSIRYIPNETDTTKFSPLLVDVMACRLALEMTEALTQSNTKKQALAEMLRVSLATAKKADSVQQPPSTLPSGNDTFIAARDGVFS